MGELILYYRDKIAGGIYDDGLFVTPIKECARMKFGKLYISKSRMLMIVLYLILQGLMFTPCMEMYNTGRPIFDLGGVLSAGTKSYYTPFFTGLILLNLITCLSPRFWAWILRMIFGLLLLGSMLAWFKLLNCGVLGAIGNDPRYALNVRGICCIVLAAGVNVINIIFLVKQRRKKEGAKKEP